MVDGPRRHFSKLMHSPYFQTQHYKEEHTSLEQKIEKPIIYVLNKILFWKDKDVLR